MPNIKLEIEYEGSNYCGWQVQNSRQSSVVSHQKKAIQEVIEKALRKILQEKVRLIASGRTDAGVHAKAQAVNFKTSFGIKLEKLQMALNSLLPADITVSKVEEAKPDFHSRFNAKSKIYRYAILNRGYPSALLRGRAYFVPHRLNLKLMRKESQYLLGSHDFKSFCASHSSAKNMVRTIKKISIKKLSSQLLTYSSQLKDSPIIVIDIEADGFLYNMVRNIVGTLIEIGRGRFKKGYLKKLLLAKNRRLAGPTAPAYGLCLMKVNY
jgi:tRNA pseudouridine38-40 synthase